MRRRSSARGRIGRRAGPVRRRGAPDFTTVNERIVAEFRANGGNVGGRSGLLLLTTTGARAGLRRTTPLAYTTDGERLVVASNSGVAAHPDWYNVVRNPAVEIELGTERFPARASLPTGDERDRL